MKTFENGRRSAAVAYEFGGFVLDHSQLRRRDGTVVPLTSRLLETLRFFVEHHDTVLDKEQIMEAVWPDSIVEENNLAQAVSKLRHLFGEKPGAQQFIATVPGRGYRFVAPVRNIESMEGWAPSRPNILSPTESSLAHTEEPSPPAVAPRRMAIGLAATFLFIAGLGALVLWQQSRAPKTESPGELATITEKCIAVLPFDNLSSDKTDTFFTDGIQDDILTSLGKIKDLKVIARTSTEDYHGTPSAAKLREIARALGASHVLEGSVRRIADRVVVSVALVDTRDQRQVWSERYDRTLTDTLSLQGELAVAIARELRANLTPLENSIATSKPTQNPDAYLFYLRGREAEAGTAKKPSRRDALRFYQHAVDLDPGFALARARLSMCASSLLWEQSDLQWKAKARAEAEEALRLQPQLGEAHLALTFCHMWGDNDDERALSELNRAAELLPNSAEVPLVAAILHKRHQRYRERVAALARAESLDPRNHAVLSLTHLTHRWMRNWPEAIRALERRSVVLPQSDYPLAWERAQDEFHLTGDIIILDRALAEEMAAHATRPVWLRYALYATALLKRDYAAAAEHLAALSPTELDDINLAGPKSFHEALLLVARGADPTLTRNALFVARDDCRSRLAAILNPPANTAPLASQGSGNTRDAAQFRATIGLLHAFLGEKEEAVAAATDALRLPSAPAGSIEHNQLKSALALVYARTGDPDAALDLIESILQLPTELPEAVLYNLTLADLKLSWHWDPLRKNPRFQKLLAGPEPRPAG